MNTVILPACAVVAMSLVCPDAPLSAMISRAVVKPLLAALPARWRWHLAAFLSLLLVVVLAWSMFGREGARASLFGSGDVFRVLVSVEYSPLFEILAAATFCAAARWIRSWPALLLRLGRTAMATWRVLSARSGAVARRTSGTRDPPGHASGSRQVTRA